MRSLGRLAWAPTLFFLAAVAGCDQKASPGDGAAASSDVTGEQVFNALWGAEATAGHPFGGLGPVYSRASCAGCHTRGGRGRPPESPDHPMLTMVVFLGQLDGDGRPGPHPAYGRELSPLSVPQVPREGRARLSFRSDFGVYGDGLSFVLWRPRLELSELEFGALGIGSMVSPRIAQPLFGVGALERVPEAAILAHEDADDRDGDGISGRANRLSGDGIDGALGRFGWKATQPTIARQNAIAFHGDMGITTPLFPEPNCPPVQTACLSASGAGPSPNASAAMLEAVTEFVAALPPPAPVPDPEAARGEALFASAGCDACHVPTLPDGNGGSIAAYTDLLLHDMGIGLADNFSEGDARGSEWRTAPLWGIGRAVRSFSPAAYLHDGRARSLEEAILWHGGEADAAREAFRTMPAADRRSLLAFLSSL